MGPYIETDIGRLDDLVTKVRLNEFWIKDRIAALLLAGTSICATDQPHVSSPFPGSP